MASSYATALTAAQAAAGEQAYPRGTLYVVATPIGNLADISLRALHVLQMTDRIACEDTRHTQALLRAYGIDRPLLAAHEHNERAIADRIIPLLAAGERIALVSDAGTPGISDPGARLVAAVRSAGHDVCPLPGPTSVATALSAAGLAEGDGAFVFRGFLPPRGAARNAALAALAGEPSAVVLLEAPHRIEALANDLAGQGPRRLTVARELTKQHQQIVTLEAAQFAPWLAASVDHQRGEFVIVLHPQTIAGKDDLESERVLTLLLQELPVKTAVRLAAQITGVARNTLYTRALALRADDEADERSG